MPQAKRTRKTIAAPRARTTGRGKRQSSSHIKITPRVKLTWTDCEDILARLTPEGQKVLANAVTIMLADG